ncbi:UNVERIFIED_CONTAM: hypothetical protein HDU68_009630 [Siphonaria sp. JEL0065]|nr:hypothetical protein HDU68_009630 [Siphonaria sp. JEL0065]
MEAQLQELFGFLNDGREDMRKLAAENCAGVSKAQELQPIFASNDGAAIKRLMEMLADHPLIAHDALSALVNLSANLELVKFFDNEGFISLLVITIILPDSVLADLCCMLLNNITKDESIAKKIIPEVDPKEEDEKFKLRFNPSGIIKPVTESTAGDTKDEKKPTRKTPYLDNLLEVFVRPNSVKAKREGSDEETAHNPNATYNFLAGVFANISMVPSGAKALRSRSNVDNVIRLSKLLPFLNHEGGWDTIRRGGCMSAVKNCCFDVQDETTGGLLLSAELNLVPYVLLPLCGPDDFDDEDIDNLPEDLQLLEPTKTREPINRLRLILIETLLLLSVSRPGRIHLRDMKVYYVVRAVHRQEKDEEVIDRIERLVGHVMADEEPVEEPKKKPAVMEVVDDSDSEAEEVEGPAIEEIV